MLLRHRPSFRMQAPVRTLLALLLTLSAPLAVHAGSGETAPEFVSAPTESLPTDRIIIKYRDDVKSARADAPAAEQAHLHQQAKNAAARAGQNLKLLRVGAHDTHVMRLDNKLHHTDVQQLARDIMAADPSVEYAEPDTILQAQFVPNDTQVAQQWHYYETTGGINLPAAWDQSTGSGVVVAVVDTGYRPHVDLATNVLAGYDFISTSTIANDGNARDSSALDPGDAMKAGECGPSTPKTDVPSSWHGTHVAGTIAALTNNSTGVAGTAFNAKVLPVRVLGKCGGYSSDIADGLVWASGGAVSGVPSNVNPAQVINMSLGGVGACEATIQNAINSARGRGAVVVVSAGNSVPAIDVSNFVPANCSGVVAVAATTRSGGRAYYSAYGTKVALAAPGGDLRSGAAYGILSTLNTGSTTPLADSYSYYQGTSMAAPHVSGVAALMLSKNPALTVADIEAKLKSSVRAFPASCSGCGTGIVDANAAVIAAGGSAARNEVEPNDTMSTAPMASAGLTATIYGTMGNSADTDYFRALVNPGATLSAQLTPNSTSNYDLYVYNASGSQIASSIKGTGLVDSVSVTNSLSSQAIYYVRVRYVSGGTGIRGGLYTLKIN